VLDAPGLELVEGSPPRLLGLRELDDAARSPQSATGTRVRPALAAGDALVFGGAVLHRTHLAPSMTRVRTSLELRFFSRARPPGPLGPDGCARLGDA